ncbi:MAG: carboxypeptidase M32 [Thermoleophilia bacterium]|nr:carboxypeptidase M32 [Thermoleophilia bacterium]
MTDALRELKARLAEVDDLGRAARVLGWDQQTMMPPGGAPARADQLATLGRIAHERFTAPELGRLLDRLRAHEEFLAPDSDDACLIRVTRRDYEKAVRVPAELRAEMLRAASLGHQAWVEARAASNFPAFLPHLERNVELALRYIECFEPAGEPYDVLLDDYEEGATTADVRAVFEPLKEGLLPLVAAVSERGGDPGPLRGPFPADAQRRLIDTVLTRLGFDPASWRLDVAAHPFATTFAVADIRLTTRYDEDDLRALFGAMHEFGHGLYERSVSPALERTPLAGGVSLGLHESQSRLWENLVGRGRAFCRWLHPVARAAFPDALRGVDEEAFYRAINRVVPSLIRVDADEVTYCLHVILRFELELEIVNGGLELRDLPEAWNARMLDYLGVEVPDDAHGVLQDVHWSGGTFGYFPTYALGTVMSVQIWEAARRSLPDLDAQLEAGQFDELREWLRAGLHVHGRKFAPQQMLERLVGGPIDAGPYLGYLAGKLDELYAPA